MNDWCLWTWGEGKKKEGGLLPKNIIESDHNWLNDRATHLSERTLTKFVICTFLVHYWYLTSVLVSRWANGSIGAVYVQSQKSRKHGNSIKLCLAENFYVDFHVTQLAPVVRSFSFIWSQFKVKALNLGCKSNLKKIKVVCPVQRILHVMNVVSVQICRTLDFQGLSNYAPTA